ncbi:hypothetical protein GGQ73_004719 [Rhizobium skierniewicense]|uniref:Uncharacterized protein n=1 Tax=Rhizobium skierniewicense TaxID=984260 RepID=A0A7W6G4K2_9HYPH|nr:hypothetical protein [Rhizobium skierniewicense]MBB3948724.1 hypothetical protein [Rhizobium skierniewicense]
MDELVYLGARKLGPDIMLANVWEWLHRNANHWAQIASVSPSHHNLKAIDEIDQRNLAYLNDCPAKAWQLLCAGTGETIYGASALSWCQGATFDDVVAMWRRTKVPLVPTATFVRATRLINRNVLPKANSLRSILDQPERGTLYCCILISASNQETFIDLSREDFRNAAQEIFSFARFNNSHSQTVV